MASGVTDREWAAAFSEVFSAPESPIQAEVWSTVLGDEYPSELAPYSLISRSELARISSELEVAAGDLFVDVGSGRGGPGLWVAATTGASYMAVDIAPVALSEVERRAKALGLTDRVSVAGGSFAALPLEDGAASAVMSVDALLFAPDKDAAFRELSRVVRPGGRLVFTTWDYRRQPVGRPPQVADHRPLLEAAHFRVLAYDETPDWESRQREVHRLLLASVEELAAEEGQPVGEVRRALAEMSATIDAMTRRVIAVAERQ